MPTDPDEGDGPTGTDCAGPAESTESNGGHRDEADHEGWRQVNQTHCDPEADGEFVATLVSAVAEAKDVDPLDYAEMPPMDEAVDTETLGRMLFGRAGNDTGSAEGGALSFIYDGYKVVARSDGWVLVHEPR